LKSAKRRKVNQKVKIQRSAVTGEVETRNNNKKHKKEMKSIKIAKREKA
jgi:hypothetical protein